MGVIRDLHDAVGNVLAETFDKDGETVSPLSGLLREDVARLAIAWVLAENPPGAFAGQGRTFALSVTVQTRERDRADPGDRKNLDDFNDARDRLRDAFKGGTQLTNVNQPVGSVVEDLGESLPENASQLDLLAIARSWTIAAT